MRGETGVNLAGIFNRLRRRKLVVLPWATKRACMVGAIALDEEITVMVRRLRKRELLAIGRRPRWFRVTDRFREIPPAEYAEEEAKAREWLTKLFAAAIVDPRFSAGPDIGEEEIGIEHVWPDAEALAVEIGKHSVSNLRSAHEGREG